MDETIKTFHRVLSVAGITIFAKNNWDSKLWLALQIFNVIIGFLTIVFTTFFVVGNMSDLLVCIQGACIWTTGLIMFISFCVCLVFRKQFREFLDEMGFKDAMLEMPLIEYVLKLERAGRLNELKGMVVDSQEKLLKLTRVLLKTYVFSVWACATLYLSDSVYSMLTTKDDDLRLLGFEMLVPWSLQNFTVYIVTYIFNAYSGYLCCIAYPGFQLTIILLVGQTVRQLRIITFILLNLDELVLEMTGQRDEKWQAYSTAIFSQCVDHYTKLKRFSNKLNMICRPFYLALILDAIMLVCVCSVKIAISANKTSPDTMKYYVHEFCFIMVVLMFCTLGQQVENECARLETAVTERWYIFDKTHKVHVQIFKMALSQRMPIYIFGTITLSAPTFTWFLKTGMSFFTLVMSVLEEN
ncbi:odorant receptor 13a-like [Leguminivora glycinivorella]|uniref:odorant receptor 13a-like n=1 Tax=Leguminivora glycinivorella TaxID=1035111 RepID=UPI00200D65E0|nr:odorant receptor 13a-like [Leguminivora glycinivorella]